MTAPDLTWEEIARRFHDARNWWVATAGLAGPHAVPVWGVVADGALAFYSEPTSVRSRNLAADSRLVLHLESGTDVLIVRGRIARTAPASSEPTAVAAYREKYAHPGDAEYLPDDPALGDPLVSTVEAQRALAWDVASFEGTQRRWRA